MRKYLGKRIEECQTSQSIFAIRKDCEEIELSHLGGKAPTVEMALAALSDFLEEEGLIEEVSSLYKEKNPYKVEIREGMSGCLDIFSREVVSWDWKDTPRRHLLHISMFEKVNMGMKIRLEDLPILFCEVERLFDLDGEDFSIQVLPEQDMDTFDRPSDEVIGGFTASIDRRGRGEEEEEL